MKISSWFVADVDSINEKALHAEGKWSVGNSGSQTSQIFISIGSDVR